MPTNWSFDAGQSTNGHSNGGTVTGTLAALVGELCIVAVGGDTIGAVATALTISDTGSGGWNVLNPLVTQPSQDFGGTSAAKSFWKIATAADYNGGLGVSLTATMTAAQANGIEFTCDCFALSGGPVLGVDLAASVVGNSDVTTISLSPASGSAHPANADELAWTSLYAVNPIPITGANTFAGASGTSNLGPCQGQIGARLTSQFVGGVNASATAGTNVWTNTWTASRKPILQAATFYGAGGQQIVMVV